MDDPFDLDQPEELLPEYDDDTAPAYESHFSPLFTYHLRQIDRKLQMFVPYGTPAPSSYQLFTHSFRLFSKKPHMELFRVSHPTAERIASLMFDNNGPLPWRPRAHFCHFKAGGESTHDMESRNFADWTAAIGETTYRWTLEARPISLVLETTESVVIAIFTYSSRGTSATKGADVGYLNIFHDRGREGLEEILCSLAVAITHLKRMGRHYSNNDLRDEAIRAGSLTREHFPSHRASFASSWTS